MFRIELSVRFFIFYGVEVIGGFTVGGFSVRVVGEGPVSLEWLQLEILK